MAGTSSLMLVQPASARPGQSVPLCPRPSPAPDGGIQLLRASLSSARCYTWDCATLLHALPGRPLTDAAGVCAHTLCSFSPG